ncbi:MGMT family protein [Chitinophaga sp. CF118]|uniref:MGMT family protein n=1 Tax=Chitinophaga sp. CF118 TaxID=1884367 RepID=UPI001C434D55|nr:MGMT family protein [Chitinophaga sp. CF118]
MKMYQHPKEKNSLPAGKTKKSNAARQLPKGKVITYGAIAEAAGIMPFPGGRLGNEQ